MKNKSKPTITLLCHEHNLKHIMKLKEDIAFKFSIIKMAKLEGYDSIDLKIGVVSDSNINDK